MYKELEFKVSDVTPYINWLYFYHAWEMDGKSQSQKAELRNDAEEMLEHFNSHFNTYALFGLFDANSDGDDIIINDVRIPMLRQQHGETTLCLADFVAPLNMGKDTVGVFATTVDCSMEKYGKDDIYLSMMSQTLSDRLAEATAEKMHEDVRRMYWGYAPDENITMEEELKGNYQGIRPAIGYPSLPDTSINFVISELIPISSVGIRLTETGMMQPHASVSGFMISHPQSKYFDLGAIGEDQLKDYAIRRKLPLNILRGFLQSSLMRK